MIWMKSPIDSHWLTRQWRCLVRMIPCGNDVCVALCGFWQHRKRAYMHTRDRPSRQERETETGLKTGRARESKQMDGGGGSDGWLQHTATQWNILQHAATQKRKRSQETSHLSFTAAHRSELQHTAIHCNTLEHTVTHCNTLQHTATLERKRSQKPLHHLLFTATHCNTLQLTAKHCNTLHHTATHCNTLAERTFVDVGRRTLSLTHIHTNKYTLTKHMDLAMKTKYDHTCGEKKKRITMCVCGLWRYNLKKPSKMRSHTRPWQQLCAPQRQEESESQINRAKENFERRGGRRVGTRAPWRAHIRARGHALAHTHIRYQFIIVFLICLTTSKVLLNESAYSVESSWQKIWSNKFFGNEPMVQW